MQLSLDQAAARLGKSTRQIRYLVKQGKLRARKVAGRWVIESEDLELSPGQNAAGERKQRQLLAAVEEGLSLDTENTRRSRYSVRDLKVYQIALPLHGRASESLGQDHPATRALRDTLWHLARGCHRYEHGSKADEYRAARDAASTAVCELSLSESEAADSLIVDIEQELMAALAGLLRRLDKKRLR